MDCERCKSYLPEIKDELSEQVDYWGFDSLTENQQLFFEFTNPKLCPDCMGGCNAEMRL